MTAQEAAKTFDRKITEDRKYGFLSVSWGIINDVPMLYLYVRHRSDGWESYGPTWEGFPIVIRRLGATKLIKL